MLSPGSAKRIYGRAFDVVNPFPHECVERSAPAAPKLGSLRSWRSSLDVEPAEDGLLGGREGVEESEPSTHLQPVGLGDAHQKKQPAEDDVGSDAFFFAVIDGTIDVFYRQPRSPRRGRGR